MFYLNTHLIELIFDSLLNKPVVFEIPFQMCERRSAEFIFLKLTVLLEENMGGEV